MFTKQKNSVFAESSKNLHLQQNDVSNDPSTDFHKNLRGHIVPGCSQMHFKSTEASEKSSEDLSEKKNSKWRTSKIKSINEKNILMEKFESSLKERLLNSASFTRQVPLFDGTSQDRIKTPVLIKNKNYVEEANESVYNAVFPTRKDNMDSSILKQNKEMFSKYSKDSQEWLKQLEKGDQEMPSIREKQRITEEKVICNIKDEVKVSRKESKSNIKENESNKKDKKLKKKDIDDKEDVKSRKSAKTNKKEEPNTEKSKRSKSLNKNVKKEKSEIDERIISTEFSQSSTLLKSQNNNMSHIFPQEEYKVMFMETDKKESIENIESAVNVDTEKEEALLKETSQDLFVEEEECIEDPCNEPKWFEEYGIDKKKRKLLAEMSPEEEIEFGSEESEGSEHEVKEDIDSQHEQKKKKKTVRKRKTAEEDDQQEQAKMFLRDLMDTPEKVEEIKESICTTVREIKTVPLVTLDEMELKEKVEDEEEEEIVPVEIAGPKEMPTEYLQKYVGKYLIAGLAQVALFMPKDPVEYLAQWILKERKKEKLLEEMKQFKSEIKAIRNKNMTDTRIKMQREHLRKEMAQSYKEEKLDQPYPTFDSESDLDKLLEGEEDTNPPNYLEHQNTI